MTVFRARTGRPGCAAEGRRTGTNLADTEGSGSVAESETSADGLRFARSPSPRITLVAATLLAACGTDPVAITGNASAPVESGTTDNRIACALPGAPDLALRCTFERTGDVVTVRQPDGGFRRLRYVQDGRGIVAADGAEHPQVHDLDDGSLEIAIGGARYRLPSR